MLRSVGRFHGSLFRAWLMCIVTWTRGNDSGLEVGSDLIAVKLSSICHEELTTENLAVVGLGERVVDGSCKPSSDMIAIFTSFATGRMSTAWCVRIRIRQCQGP